MTISDKDRDIIIRGVEKKLSWAVIGYLIDKNPDAVRMYYKRWKDVQELGEKTITPKAKSHVLVKRAMHDIIAENPTLPHRLMAGKLVDHGIDPNVVKSHETNRKIMKHIGYVNENAVKRNFISSQNVQKILEFAREHLQKDDAFFDTIIWSDETMVRSAPQGKEMKYWVHRTDPSPKIPKNYQIQNGGFGVMFWGCFSSFGFGPLVVVEGTMDSEKYISTIQDYLLDEIHHVKSQYGVNMVFMQDNASCHKSTQTMRFFDECGLKTLKWPPQSPDLNPIENLWAYIKRKRQQKFGLVTSKVELIDQIFEIWEGLDDEFAWVLSQSASTRLTVCASRNGEHTGY